MTKIEALYNLTDEPLRLNRFICDIELNGTQVDYRVVRGFREDFISSYLYIDIAPYKGNDYEWLFTKAYGVSKVEPECKGTVTMTSLSPDCNKVKHVEYKINRVANILYPKYNYADDNLAVYTVVLHYDGDCRDITYFRGEEKNDVNIDVNCCKCDWEVKPTNYRHKSEKHKLSKNDKAFLKGSIEMFEDAKKRVVDKYSHYENSEETLKNVLREINDAEMENKAYAETVGCMETDLNTVEYKKPNGLEVERYNRWKGKKAKECLERDKRNSDIPSFGFLDFNTALEWFKWNMLPEGTAYEWVPKMNDVDYDIENNERATVVVCSRCCGITTHMMAWALAKISTNPNIEIWYVTVTNQMSRHIFGNIPGKIRDIEWLKINNSKMTIENKDNNSKIRFVGIKNNINTFLVGKDVPDYVIYDDMAFMGGNCLNSFLDILDLKETASGKHAKEICVSTPSKDGSIFNFLALIANNPIYIPWYEKASRNIEDWEEQMKKIMGDENFNIEFNCQIGTDDDVCTGDEPWAKHFEKDGEDYEKHEKKDYEKPFTKVWTTDDLEEALKKVVGCLFDEEDKEDDGTWYEIECCDDKQCECVKPCKKKHRKFRETFAVDYGNQFPDKYPEDRNNNKEEIIDC